MVCRAFLLAYRILKKIVETDGDTDMEWLKHGAPHFKYTEVGVKRLENVFEVESESSTVLVTVLVHCRMGCT
jgi:hypothetical protein